MKQWLKRSAIEATKRRRFICNNFREIERKLLMLLSFNIEKKKINKRNIFL